MAQLQGGNQYNNAVAVTAADASVFSFLAFTVGVTGAIVIRAENSNADVTMTATAGIIYPISIIAVRLTGTTATGIVGLS
jgi:hypothetical protein